MSKKTENVANDLDETDKNKQNVKNSNPKTDKKVENNKKAKKQKVAKKGGIGKKLKETGSELKKVTWPDFPKVVKKTGVVIAVVIIFTVILFGVDRLIGFLFSLLTKN
jgi:preprotein translocase subunit SecE